MRKKLKEEKGFAAQDGLIAVLIIALFTGVIATISYNIYLAKSSAKRISKATSYIVDVFEYIDKIYYDDVTTENLTDYFNNKYYYQAGTSLVKSDAEVKAISTVNNGNDVVIKRKLTSSNSQTQENDTPFKAEISVLNYNQTEGNQDKFDLVKEITMKVSYKLGNKNQIIEMKTIKQREKLEIPNKPDISSFELQEGEYVYCVKNTNVGWIYCEPTDSEWYNYENGNWPIVLKTNSEKVIGEKVDIHSLPQGEAIYGWIARYAYDSANNKVEFLFSNTNRTIKNQEEDGKEYNKVLEIDESVYIIPDAFSLGDREIEGLWTNDTTTKVFKYLNDVYPLIL